MNELYFLAIDVVEEVTSVINVVEMTCTNGMTESELKAYKLGVSNVISALKATVEDEEIPVINISGMDIPTELSIDELEEYYNSN